MRTTTILLAAIGLLLVGVAVTRTPGQQAVAVVQGACCLPTGGCRDEFGFNQGQCEQEGGIWLGDNTSCIGSICPGPPTVVGGGIALNKVAAPFFVRLWSDGRVDFISPNGCEGMGSVCLVVPGSCLTDIDGDGDTGITDFLDLLANWGPCP